MAGFVKATSNNLPQVNIFMVHEVLKNDERFNIAEVAGAKASSSTRESYGDNAIGYVELKREAGSVCLVKARICPEHKVRSKAYSVEISIDEKEEKVVNLLCHDCAAAAGGCKHVLAFLMWLNRRSEDPSPTEVTSYWKKPVLSGVGTSVKFIEVYELSTGTPKAGTSAAMPDASIFFNELLAEGNRQQIDCHLTRSIGVLKNKFSELSVHNLLINFKKQGGVMFIDFLSYLQTFVTANLCKEAEEATRTQAKSSLWFELRYARITASKLYEISRCKTEEGTLVETIIGAYKVKPTAATERGKLLERKVVKVVEEKLKTKLGESGLFLIPEYPIFGASPDALSPKYVIEIKCPLTEKAMKNYIKNDNITNKFKAQVHLQMLATGRKKALFCVAEPDFEHSKSVKLIWVDYDEEYLTNIMKKCQQFYEQCIFNKLFSSL